MRPRSRWVTEGARSAGAGRRRLVAVLLVTAALMAGPTVLLRPLTSPEFEVFAAVGAERGPQWWFALLGGVATGSAWILAGAVAWGTVRARGSRWVTVGAPCTTLGGLLFAAGFFAFGATNWYLTGPGLSPTAFNLFRADPARVFGVQAVGFVLGMLGVLLLATGLWRSRAVPRWIAAAMGAAPVLMVTIGDDGRLYDALHAGHMATLAALGVHGLVVSRPAPAPAFRGVDHLALSVTDVARSARFYVDVLGFTAVLEGPGSVLCVHKGTAFTLGLVRHPGSCGEPFSHERTGLDHLGLVARDRAELERWTQLLTERGVAFDGITDETLGHHLHLRDPDGIALELYAPNAVYAAARAELRARPFTDEELRARAGQLLGLDADAGAATVRVVDR